MTEDQPKKACPALKFVSGKDEFERKESSAAAAASCSGDNQTAVAFGRSCPLTTRFDIRLGDYDFEAKRYRIEAVSHGSSDTVLLTSSGRVYIPKDSWLLTWRGSHSPSNQAGLPKGGCVGPLNDTVPSLMGLVLDVPMAEEEARAFRGRLTNTKARDTLLEVAFLVTGSAAEDDVACGFRTPRSAEGTALAWRLIGLPESGTWDSGPNLVLLDWISVGSWQPSASCDGEGSFYGLEPGALGKSAKVVRTQCPVGSTAGGGYETGCTCWRDTTEVGAAPRPPGDCEKRPTGKERDCLWRCR